MYRIRKVLKSIEYVTNKEKVLPFLAIMSLGFVGQKGRESVPFIIGTRDLSPCP
jgi:hypothetical protein